MKFTEKYRPKKLNDFYGNEQNVAILKRYIETGNIPHAILFYGQCGIGKTTLAQILAKTIKGNNTSEIQILSTAQYRQYGEKLGPDIYYYASRNNLFKPDVFILNEAHSMSKGQQESILEPMEKSESSYFFLTTTEPKKLIDAIRSRCQPFYLAPLGKEVMESFVYHIFNREEVIEPTAREVASIVKQSAGIPRHALQMIEHTILMN